MNRPHTLQRIAALLAAACLGLLFSCGGQPSTGLTSLRPASLAALRDHLLGHPADLAQFRLRGPFTVTQKRDLALNIEGELIAADLYLSGERSPAPLVILLHGYGNGKETHGYQALHLATWGMHALAVQLPNHGPWIRNGHSLARLARAIQANPALLDARIDPARIILAGHSFGASATAVALSVGAPAAGAILLDPAGVSRAIPSHLRRIKMPVVVLASDERITLTRNRGYFYQYIPAQVASVSITDAAHEDAEFPLEPVARSEDADTAPVEEVQVTYVSAITASAFSLAFTGRIDYAWESFAAPIKAGRMFGEQRK